MRCVDDQMIVYLFDFSESLQIIKEQIKDEQNQSGHLAMVRDTFIAWFITSTYSLAGWRITMRYQMASAYQEVFFIIIIKISASVMPWSQLELLVLARFVYTIRPSVCTHTEPHCKIRVCGQWPQLLIYQPLLCYQ